MQMIGIIIAFLLGYWLGEKKEPTQSEYSGIGYGYVRDGESVRDLT